MSVWGKMNLQHLTGSDQVLSSINFMKNGTMSVKHCDFDLDPEDFATLQMTQDFLLYSLTRDDWLMEYLGDLNESLYQKESELKKSHLTLIKGGLAD